MYDSSFLGDCVFLIAMVVYTVSLPFSFSADSGDQAVASWLWLWGAILFLGESLLDSARAASRWYLEVKEKVITKTSSVSEPATCLSLNTALTHLESRESQITSSLSASSSTMLAAPLAAVTARMHEHASPSQPDALGQHTTGSTTYCPWLDTVHWDTWAAVWFVIPSILYLWENFLDPNVVELSWTNPTHLSDYGFECAIDSIAVYMFIFDAVLCLVGRYSINRTIDTAKILWRLRLWNAASFLELDWRLYGDLLYLVGACFQVPLLSSLFPFSDVLLPSSNSRSLNYFTSVLWILDAVCYMIGDIPEMTNSYVTAAGFREDMSACGWSSP